MPDFSWSQALPVGLILFCGTLFAFTRRKAGRSLARRDYPKLADRLGLRFEAPRYSGWVGRISGTFRGHWVRVESDERARILCSFVREPGLDFRNYPHWKRAPTGFQSFSLGSRAEDRWFATRFARDELGDGVGEYPEVKRLVEVLRPHRERLKTFSLDQERIECVFDFGTPSYLPVSVAEELVPALVKVAEELEGRAQRSGLAGASRELAS